MSMPQDNAVQDLSTHRYALSIDVGGTFTDFVLFDTQTGTLVALHKSLTTPREPARAVIDGWRALLAQHGAGAGQIGHVVHSTTLITNALVERRGARTALLTTRGFRDVLEIGIEQIYDIYDLYAPYPEPLIPRRLRREVTERMSRDGRVLVSLDYGDTQATIDDLAAEGVESIAVALIHAYRNPTHERQIADIVATSHPNITLSLSSQVAPLIGEYERTSTVAADAYVKPLFQRYLLDLRTRLRELGFERHLYLMLSSGGISSAPTALEYPIRLLESGPAAGAHAASLYGRLAGYADVLSFDMGGTTAKACLIERGSASIAHMLEADRVHRFKPGSGLPIMTPTLDLIEIGAGGGSVARIDQLGLLKVGPHSAGADPGPACYGRGGDRPTVTDADLVLGYLDPTYFLGGKMELDRPRADAAVRREIAQPLRLDTAEAAWGIYTVVNENMARAARTHLIERNRDPRDLALVAFGGAGPAHAAAVARILEMRTVIVPMGAGVASAIGALAAPMVLPFARSYLTQLRHCDWHLVHQLYAEMIAEAHRALTTEDGDPLPLLRAGADMRFAGQYHVIHVALPPVEELGPHAADQIEERFRRRYTEVYGRALSTLPLEVQTWHLTAERARASLAINPEARAGEGQRPSPKGEREAYFAAPAPGYRLCAVYDRYRLVPGTVLDGPCIVEETEATIVVPPGDCVTVDEYRTIVIHLRKNGDER
jgi:N-methylhydantoinase A/oxoprolinase/acetone carboxylase beta subunit